MGALSLLKALVDECYNLFPEKAKAGAFDFKSLHAWRIGNPHDRASSPSAAEVQAILRSLVAECGADTPVLRTSSRRRTSAASRAGARRWSHPLAQGHGQAHRRRRLPAVGDVGVVARVGHVGAAHPDVPDTLRREVRQAVEGLDATPTTLALPSLVGRRELVLPLLALALALVLLLAWAAAAPPRRRRRSRRAATSSWLPATSSTLIAAALGQGSAALGQGAAVGPWLAVGVTSNARLAKGAADATARALAEAGAGGRPVARRGRAAPRVREVVARGGDDAARGAARDGRDGPRARGDGGARAAPAALARLATAVSTAAAKAAARARRRRQGGGARDGGRLDGDLLRVASRRVRGARRRARSWSPRTWRASRAPPRRAQS